MVSGRRPLSAILVIVRSERNLSYCMTACMLLAPGLSAIYNRPIALYVLHCPTHTSYARTYIRTLRALAVRKLCAVRCVIASLEWHRREGGERRQRD
eukprot:scaffold4141_cov155-Isochrysis_galbana.AAC.1